MVIRLSDDEKLYILAHINRKGICEIAKSLKRTEPCVREYLKSCGIQYKTLKDINNIKINDVIFSPREFEILQLISKGLSNSEICNAICVERTTLATHLHNIYGKLSLFETEKSTMRVNAVLWYFKNVKGLAI